MAGLYWTASLAHVIQDCVHQLEREGRERGGRKRTVRDGRGGEYMNLISSETTTSQLSGSYIHVTP